LSLRSSASEVTLSGLAGGEYLPFPASKGPAFPFLLTLDGYPTSPAIYAQGQWCSLKIQEIQEAQTLDLRPFRFDKNGSEKIFNIHSRDFGTIPLRITPIVP
jgi:hypothetical protein